MILYKQFLSVRHYDYKKFIVGTGSTVHDVDISDEHQTLQVPLAWHDLIVDGSYYQLFFFYYFLFSNTSLVPLALSCLVQLSSVRRSLLNGNERLTVLNLITTGKIFPSSFPFTISETEFS